MKRDKKGMRKAFAKAGRKAGWRQRPLTVDEIVKIYTKGLIKLLNKL